VKREWQHRWARAYERSRARTRRRVDELISRLGSGDDLSELDRLIGEAAAFQNRVHAMLLGPSK
jgi:hypothetical protein